VTGLLALAGLQLAVAPGWLISRAVFRTGSPGLINRLAFAFGASLTANYLVVSTLAFFHLYTTGTIAMVLVLEGLMIVQVLVMDQDTMTGAAERGVARFREAWRTFFAGDLRPSYFLRVALLAAAAGVAVNLARAAVHNAGGIFEGWDAVVSWNRWAGVFAANQVPLDTGHYPQLLPANWSLSYLLLGSPLQFVAHGLMPGFLLLLVLQLVWAGLAFRSTAFLAAAVLVQVLHKYAWTDGYADVPVAVMGFEAVFWILLAGRASGAGPRREALVAGAVIAAGAAVTKQAGLYVFLLYPVLVHLLARPAPRREESGTRPVWAAWGLLGAVVVLPFYAWVQLRIEQGLTGSEVWYVTGVIYHGAGLWERFTHACASIVWLPGNPVRLAAVLACWALSLGSRQSRVLSALVVVPYFLIWALFFSYDLRNAALFVQFLCLCAGEGIAVLAERLDGAPRSTARPRPTRRALRPAARLAVLAGVLAVAVRISPTDSRLSAERLLARQDRLLLAIGEPEVNAGLAAYFEGRTIAGGILTDYAIMNYLPRLREHCVMETVVPGRDRSLPYGLEDFRANLKVLAVRYLLLPRTSDPAILAVVNQRVAAGSWREISGFERTRYRFIALRGAP